MSFYIVIDGAKKELHIEAEDMIVDRRAPNEHYTLFYNIDKKTGKQIEVRKFKNMRDYELILDPRRIKKLKNVITGETSLPEAEEKKVEDPEKVEHPEAEKEPEKETADNGSS